MTVLDNPKHYAKERRKKSNKMYDDDDKEKLDNAKFQDMFSNVTDDFVE